MGLSGQTEGWYSFSVTYSNQSFNSPLNPFSMPSQCKSTFWVKHLYHSSQHYRIMWLWHIWSHQFQGAESVLKETITEGLS